MSSLHRIVDDNYRDNMSTEEIRNKLHGQLEPVLHHLLPNGRARGKQFHVGNIQGDKGNSLKVELKGVNVGLWQDFATGDKGDIFDLWSKVKGMDAKTEFPRLIEDIKSWLGVHTPFQSSAKAYDAPTKRIANNDNLGKPTAEWPYTDVHGKVIAKKFRYEVNGEKSYLPWDEEIKKYKMPESRPLYNLPGITISRKVILVEGEKCAQALIDKGICATTAMGGANASMDKTDWLPLRGKDIIIWPDNDEVGKSYAQSAYEKLINIGVKSVKIIDIPEGKIAKWDAADAIVDGFDVEEFIKNSTATKTYSRKRIPLLKTRAYKQDKTPIGEDLVSPSIITPSALAIIGGASKVGKSDFLLNWMAHMAAGVPFLGMIPARPLKICFLQTEIEYDYLRQRINSLCIDENLWPLVEENLSLTPKVDLLLNQAKVEELIEDIKDHFQEETVDLIVIDPLYDVFDNNGSDLGENDNHAMNIFLRDRVEYLRDQINPKAGIIISHHLKKISKATFEESPFDALAGASCIRRRFTTGIIIYCPDEEQSARKLFFELRNGKKMKPKWIDKIDNKWVELEPSSIRITNQMSGNKQDAERNRKQDKILEVIDKQAKRGNVFTTQQFCEVFENKKGLGSVKSIRERLEILASTGYIKFFKNAEIYGFPPPERSKYGYLCIENMQLKTEKRGLVTVLPTNYKCPANGGPLEIEDPKTWIYYNYN